MPARLNAKGPGEFIRDHLQEPSVGGRDYVGSMYQAYKDHLRSGGIRRFPCRSTFHKYVWLLKETGAIVFDGAEAISFGTAPPEDLPPDYEPACGMPAPRHYYRILDAQHPAFDRPEAVWRQHRGLAAPTPPPRPTVRVRVIPQPITPAPPRIAPPPPTEVPSFDLPGRPGRRSAQQLTRHLRGLEDLGLDTPEVAEELDRVAEDLRDWLDQLDEAIAREEGMASPDQARLATLQEQRQALEDAINALGQRDPSTGSGQALARAIAALGRAFPAGAPRVVPARRPTVADSMEEEARTFRPRIRALRDRPDPGELVELEEAMLGFFDRVLDAAERARGENRRRLLELGQRFERAAEGFEQARTALAEGRRQDYQAALDLLAECCPP